MLNLTCSMKNGVPEAETNPKGMGRIYDKLQIAKTIRHISGKDARRRNEIC